MMEGGKEYRARPLMAFIAGPFTIPEAPSQHGARHATLARHLGGDAGGEFLGDKGRKPPQQRFQQRFLGSEVIKQAPLGHPGFPGGGFQGQGGDAAGDDQVFRRVQDAGRGVSGRCRSIHAL